MEKCLAIRHQFLEEKDELMSGHTKVAHGAINKAFRQCVGKHLLLDEEFIGMDTTDWYVANIHWPRELLIRNHMIDSVQKSRRRISTPIEKKEAVTYDCHMEQQANLASHYFNEGDPLHTRHQSKYFQAPCFPLARASPPSRPGRARLSVSSLEAPVLPNGALIYSTPARKQEDPSNTILSPDIGPSEDECVRYIVDKCRGRSEDFNRSAKNFQYMCYHIRVYHARQLPVPLLSNNSLCICANVGMKTTCRIFEIRRNSKAFDTEFFCFNCSTRTTFSNQEATSAESKVNFTRLMDDEKDARYYNLVNKTKLLRKQVWRRDQRIEHLKAKLDDPDMQVDYGDFSAGLQSTISKIFSQLKLLPNEEKTKIKRQMVKNMLQETKLASNEKEKVAEEYAEILVNRIENKAKAFQGMKKQLLFTSHEYKIALAMYSYSKAGYEAHREY
jgi:hypothetical protein